MAKNVKEVLVRVESKQKELDVLHITKLKYLDDIEVGHEHVEQTYAVILPTKSFLIKADSFQDVTEYLEEKFHITSDSLAAIVLIREGYYKRSEDGKAIYTRDEGILDLYDENIVNDLKDLLNKAKKYM